MDQYKKRRVNLIVGFLIFLVAVVLQIKGQQMIANRWGLFIQLLSLALLLVLLYLYNRKYR